MSERYFDVAFDSMLQKWARVVFESESDDTGGERILASGITDTEDEARAEAENVLRK